MFPDLTRLLRPDLPKRITSRRGLADSTLKVHANLAIRVHSHTIIRQLLQRPVADQLQGKEKGIGHQLLPVQGADRNPHEDPAGVAERAKARRKEKAGEVVPVVPDKGVDLIRGLDPVVKDPERTRSQSCANVKPRISVTTAASVNAAMMVIVAPAQEA